jgi:membrane glycosyltransferase
MAYLSAALWFLFLLLSTALLAVHALIEPDYFVVPFQLFPLWPEWRPGRAIALLGTTATLLFLPKFAAVLLACSRGAQPFGGAFKMGISMVGEFVLSALLAPIRMLFHTQFVTATLAGWTIQWKSPPREDAEITWGMAVRRHGLHTLLGILWAGGVYWLNPEYLWWLLPVVGALIVSIPVSVYTSRTSLGRGAKRAGIFAIPEEIQPPREIQRAHEFFKNTRNLPDFGAAIRDPVVNALVCANGSVRVKQPPQLQTERARHVQRVLAGGPHTLTAREKLLLLGDAVLFSQLHAQVAAGDAESGLEGT